MPKKTASTAKIQYARKRNYQIKGVKKKATQLKPYQFKKGVSGNPKGRPKGSRNAFAESFMKDFLNDWTENGVSAIVACREEKPAEYIKIGASLLPKDFNLTASNEAELEKILDQFSTEELTQILTILAAHEGDDTEEAAED